jgi:catechol 2,3-dioxygenase-like lactoylglutathione lyase family enzyme
MIDHLGFPVSDYDRSKAFYGAALAPLGYALIMETETGHPAVGFGRNGKPDFWIGGEAGSMAACMSPSRRPTAPRSTNSTKPRSPPAARTMALPACGLIITRTITAPSCSIRTATT